MRAKVPSLEPKGTLNCPLGSQNTLNCPFCWLKHDKVPSWEPTRALKCPLKWREHAVFTRFFLFAPSLQEVCARHWRQVKPSSARTAECLSEWIGWMLRTACHGFLNLSNSSNCAFLPGETLEFLIEKMVCWSRDNDWIRQESSGQRSRFLSGMSSLGLQLGSVTWSLTGWLLPLTFTGSDLLWFYLYTAEADIQQ